MSVAVLALKSFRNRKLSVGLAIASITLSVALLLDVEILRNEAKSSFASTVSGTDLIVGARSGSVNLLLYSVFRWFTRCFCLARTGSHVPSDCSSN